MGSFPIMRGRIAWLLPVLVLCSWLYPATTWADDCGVELVEALRAKYSLREMSADKSMVRDLLCHEDSASGGSAGGFSVDIPAEVPFGMGMTQEERHQHRVQTCGDRSLWEDDERVRVLTESLLDDNALEAYKTCKATPGVQCSSRRQSDRDVVFTAQWVPFAQLADATQTHEPVTQNLVCRHPSMQVGHVFLGNTPAVAMCEIQEPEKPASLLIPTNRGDFVCSIKPRPQAKTLTTIMDACRRGRRDACDEALLRTHEAEYRCRRAAEPNVPAGATPQQRAQILQDADLKTRECTDLVGSMHALTGLVQLRRAGCSGADCTRLDDMITRTSAIILAALRRFGLDE